MWGLTGEELMRLPVRLRGIRLGRPTDLILHPGGARVLGLDVECGDEWHRFLPASAAKPSSREIEVGSPVVLLDLSVESIYGSGARALSKLRGLRVGDDGATLDDVVVGAGWAIEELVLDGEHGRRRVSCNGQLSEALVAAAQRRSRRPSG
jgi:hypothetical protein